MQNNKIVVALGRNCFGETFPEQKKNVKKAAVAIADIVEAKYDVIITHSNGAQVGMLQTAMTEFSRLEVHCCTSFTLWSSQPGLYRIRPSECHKNRAFKQGHL